jgi:hypothetical protein
MKYMGIDPSMRLNGLAVCIIAESKCYFKRYKNLAQWAEEVMTWDKDVYITVEDSSLQNTTFARYRGVAGGNKINRNIGMNQAASIFIIDWLVLKEFTVRAISPEQKGRKWTTEYAETVARTQKLELTNIKKLSQDEIDAFQLALISLNYYAGKNNKEAFKRVN